MDSKDVIAMDASPEVQIPLHQDVVLRDVGVDEAQLQVGGPGSDLGFASSAAPEIAAANRQSALSRPVEYCGGKGSFPSLRRALNPKP